MALYPEPPVPLGAGRDDHRRDIRLPFPSPAEIDYAEVVDQGLEVRAAAILAAHRAGQDGWCSGCLRIGIMMFYPCSVVWWAARDMEEGLGSASTVGALLRPQHDLPGGAAR